MARRLAIEGWRATLQAALREALADAAIMSPSPESSGAIADLTEALTDLAGALGSTDSTVTP